MSPRSLIDWFEQLLFGSMSCVPSPPQQVKSLILRMEAENIPWSHIILHGGFTAFPYQVHGDLNLLIDYLEKQLIPDNNPFKTRAVSKFWDELRLLLAKRNAEKPPALPTPSKRDNDILKEFLTSSSDGSSKSYESAAFWGEVARKFINLRRTVSAALPTSPDDYLKRVVQLYEITCQARGQYFDPFNMYLVPSSEYVNAAHWQSDKNLETFMLDRPLHPLTLSVQALLKRTVSEVLHAEKPKALLNPCPRLDALLHNVQVIHEAVQQVPHDNAPPKMIDVLQRLLALSYRDGLWEKDIPPIQSSFQEDSLNLLYLTEQLRIAERERHLLLTANDTVKSDSEQPEHTCSDYLYARDKHRMHSRA